MAVKLLRRNDAGEYERVVMAEVLIPNVVNSHGDLYSHKAIKEFAYEYAKRGYGIDVNHDEIDVKGEKAFVVESFIARAGDPDFIEGSWVVGMYVPDDDLWAMVLAGEINGFSFQADVYMTSVEFVNLRNRQVSGETEPDPFDGHTHTYLVVLDALNRPISGGTGVSAGHSHRIVTHTVTEPALSVFGSGEHTHRYQVIQDETESLGEG